jgi:hypothetical protein
MYLTDSIEMFHLRNSWLLIVSVAHTALLELCIPFDLNVSYTVLEEYLSTNKRVIKGTRAVNYEFEGVVGSSELQVADIHRRCLTIQQLFPL